MDRFMKVIAVMAVGAMLCSAGLLAYMFIQQQRATAASNDPLTPTPGYEAMIFPEFAMIDQNEVPFSKRDFEGRVSIVAFVFSNCPLACPGMMTQMRKVYDQLDGTAVKFVSISLDPKRDTPARLREWASEYGADKARWRLLTGEIGLSQRILAENLKMHVQDDPSQTIGLKDGTTMNNIQHPISLLLIGPKGELLGAFNTQSAEQMDALRDRAKAASALLTR